MDAFNTYITFRGFIKINDKTSTDLPKPISSAKMPPVGKDFTTGLTQVKYCKFSE